MNKHLKNLKNVGKFFPELILFLIFVLISFSIFNYEKNFTNYVFTENLINYEGGFIRRGFLGAIALFFYQSFEIEPKLFFVSIYFFLYFSLILIFFYFINFLKKENFYLSILIVLSPATLFFILFDNNALFRKEIFFIIIFFIHVLFAKKVLEKKLIYENYLKFNLFFVIPFLFLNILIHEFQFFLLFFHYLINLIVLRFLNKKNNIFKNSYIFLTIIFIITILSGSETSVLEIENSLITFIPEIKNDYGPTDMLNGNINLVIGSFLKMIISSKFVEFLQVFLMLLFSVILFLYIFNKLLEKNNFKSTYFESYNCIFIIYIFVILLLFILTAFDFGRLFHIITMHIIGFYIILPYKSYKFSSKSLSENLILNISIFSYFLFFSMPQAHILMGKGSMYLNYGNGVINYFIQNLEPFIQKILS
tara:strand:+ start:301 stop:1563 length:1263 start_codon:yes stop_codon:yes gene_type:complete